MLIRGILTLILALITTASFAYEVPEDFNAEFVEPKPSASDESTSPANTETVDATAIPTADELPSGAFIHGLSQAKAVTPLACGMIENLVQENLNFQTVLVGADALLVSKKHRRLWAFVNGNPVKSYNVSLGQNPVGAKEFEGDLKTPEGLYRISNKNPQSKYRKALGISYPEKKDILRARQLGKPPGADIMLHGMPVNSSEYSFAIYKNATTRAWTRGCVAVENKEIDELYPKVSIGTPILICP